MAHDLEYSLSCTALLYKNRHQESSADLVSILHQLRYRFRVTNANRFKISNSFTHELGFQYFFDSISRFQPDENTLDTHVDFMIGKNLTLTVFSNLTTRFFNSYMYTTNQRGTLVKTLSAAFLTPLVWTFSTGFACVFPRLGTLSFGLSSAKLTGVRNRAVYTGQNITEFYGVPKEKSHILEYGLSMHFLADKDFLKRVHWNCDVLIFKNYRKPVDITMKNFIGIRINRFVKTSLQTRLSFENEASKKVQMEHLVSVGFYFNL